MGIFLGNPPEPCCEPTRPEQVGIVGGDPTFGSGKCGKCRCVPPKWKLTIPQSLAGGWPGPGFGGPPGTANGDPNALTYILSREPWSSSDVHNDGKRSRACRWTSRLLVNEFIKLAGLAGWGFWGAPTVPRFELMWRDSVIPRWVITDFGWVAGSVGGAPFVGLEYLLLNAPQLIDPGALYFRCLGQNAFIQTGLDPPADPPVFVHIKPWYE